MQVTQMEQEMRLTPLLRQAFRPFFLFGASFSIIAVGLWIAILGGWVSLPVYGNILFWHAHEMLFGFVTAIILGFLLTAVQNWTGQRATHGMTLFVLVMLWSLARLALLFGAYVPALAVVIIDLSVLPIAALLFARLLLNVNQTRNLFFVPILLLLTATNAMMHAGLWFEQYAWQVQGAYAAVFLITLLMSVIGGRVIPMFTANGTGTARVSAWPWLERAALSCSWLIAAMFLFSLDRVVSGAVLALLFAFACVFHTIRWLRWRPWITWRVPLVWSLHGAYAFIPVGLGLLAIYYAQSAGLLATHIQLAKSTALHALTVGAMGSLILAMMARISLGHSGRPLKSKPVMSVAFLLIVLAALARVVGIVVMPEATFSWLLVAALGWMLSYGCFVGVYQNILRSPRADGRPG